MLHRYQHDGLVEGGRLQLIATEDLAKPRAMLWLVLANSDKGAPYAVDPAALTPMPATSSVPPDEGGSNAPAGNHCGRECCFKAKNEVGPELTTCDGCKKSNAHHVCCLAYLNRLGVTDPEDPADRGGLGFGASERRCKSCIDELMVTVNGNGTRKRGSSSSSTTSGLHARPSTMGVLTKPSVSNYVATLL